MKRMIGLALAGMAMTAVIAQEKAAVAPALEVGQEAPAFSLPGSDGENYSLDQFKGKKAVVLAWFPKAFTGG